MLVISCQSCGIGFRQPRRLVGRDVASLLAFSAFSFVSLAGRADLQMPRPATGAGKWGLASRPQLLSPNSGFSSRGPRTPAQRVGQSTFGEAAHWKKFWTHSGSPTIRLSFKRTNSFQPTNRVRDQQDPTNRYTYSAFLTRPKTQGFLSQIWSFARSSIRTYSFPILQLQLSCFSFDAKLLSIFDYFPTTRLDRTTRHHSCLQAK